MKQRHQANVIRPMYPVWIVDHDGDEVEKDLTEDRLRPVVGTDGSDDCVHVDAKTGEVHHGLHSTDASNCGLSLGLARIGKIHNVLGSSFCLTQKLLFDKNFIPLRKKSRWFHWISFKFETGNLLGCKIPLEHMGYKDLWHDPNQNLSWSDTGEVLMLGQLQCHLQKICKSTGLSCMRLIQNHLHPFQWNGWSDIWYQCYLDIDVNIDVK